MSLPVEESRIVRPYFPPLSHIALVNVALPFFHNFHPETLVLVKEEIEQGNSSTVNEGYHENTNDNYNRAKANLDLIPTHLRKAVLQAVFAFHYAFMEWCLDHSIIFGVDFCRRILSFYKERLIYLDIVGEVICRLVYWRSDGTIDRIKTAEQWILNEKIEVRLRFELACMYCCEESIRTLWKAMETSGTTENFDGRNNFMVHFWVRWLRDGTRVPWTEAVCEYLEIPDNELFLKLRSPIRFSSFFHLLRLEDRQKFLPSIKFAAPDDLRFCLYAMTQEEASQVLTGFGLRRLFELYLFWPLQDSFLEIAEKMWTVLNIGWYWSILIGILECAVRKKDFNYFKLFELVWIKSPDHLKEGAKAFQLVDNQGLTLAKKIKMTRKVFHDRTKKWIRKNGRLQSRSGKS